MIQSILFDYSSIPFTFLMYYLDLLFYLLNEIHVPILLLPNSPWIHIFHLIVHKLDCDQLQILVIKRLLMQLSSYLEQFHNRVLIRHLLIALLNTIDQYLPLFQQLNLLATDISPTCNQRYFFSVALTIGFEIVLYLIKQTILVINKMLDIFRNFKIKLNISDIILAIFTVVDLFLNHPNIVDQLLSIKILKTLDQFRSKYHDIHIILNYKFRFQTQQIWSWFSNPQNIALTVTNYIIVRVQFMNKSHDLNIVVDSKIDLIRVHYIYPVLFFVLLVDIKLALIIVGQNRNYFEHYVHAERETSVIDCK